MLSQKLVFFMAEWRSVACTNHIIVTQLPAAGHAGRLSATLAIVQRAAVHRGRTVAVSECGKPFT